MRQKIRISALFDTSSWLLLTKSNIILVGIAVLTITSFTTGSTPVLAFQSIGTSSTPSSNSRPIQNRDTNNDNNNNANIPTVAYKSLSLPLPEFGIEVPVACWFPYNNQQGPSINGYSNQFEPAKYQHRISVRRIGQLLAGWDWIPEIVSKDYTLQPTGILSLSSYLSSPTSNRINVINGNNLTLPLHDSNNGKSSLPVVLLAHGYLGSRYDLSHLAEELAAYGFVCVAAEYPESLAASYDRTVNENLNRKYINDQLLIKLENDWKIATAGTKFGIIGHSLGTSTVFTTGTNDWVRICIAGFPRNYDGSSTSPNALFISSMNDSAVSLNRFGGKQAFINAKYPLLNEQDTLSKVLNTNNPNQRSLESRGALIIDRPDGPNHISFLAESVNNAMIDFLSPLLPVARALDIPVLDFDKYKLSQDSVATATVVHPIIIQYLKQEMKLL